MRLVATCRRSTQANVASDVARGVKPRFEQASALVYPIVAVPPAESPFRTGGSKRSIKKATMVESAASPFRAALKRSLTVSGLIAYSLSLLLLFDVIYSSVTQRDERELNPRRRNPIYGHELAAKFDGYDVWGEERYRLITNSLGFKDASTRDVLLKSNKHRVLLIGDSFTEAIGMPFEKSFGGLLALAGDRSDKIEFLNAGVSDYQPINYYKKVKHLLDRGLQFDHVLLLPDSSDTVNEATSKFCIDDDPEYSAYCNSNEVSWGAKRERRTWDETFVITNRARVMIKFWFQMKLGNRRKALETDFSYASWTMDRSAPEKYEPLGRDRGIKRSLKNVTRLSDLLAQKGIPLTVAVYPWPQQIARNDRDSLQVSLWRNFCEGRCKAFINLFPTFFDAASRNKDWYERLYIFGDVHFSEAGNRILYEELWERCKP